MAEKKYSPGIEQYLSIKRQYEGYLVFFRLGDFYEMFFEDAVTASRELDLVLTGRDGGGEERIPMCGVPYHAAEGYLARLVSKGFKVVICEQMESTSEATGGLIRREVTRIVTPGTLIESALLDEGSNNYIASLCMGSEQSCGLALAEVSTGAFFITGFSGPNWADELLGELSAYAPSEVILAFGLDESPRLSAYLRERSRALVNDNLPELFDATACSKAVEQQFNKPLDELGLAGQGSRVRASGALITYLRQTQKADLSYMSAPTLYEGGAHMALDNVTRRNLELCSTLRGGEKKGSLLWVLDRTKTAGGARLLRAWIEKPLLNIHEILRRQRCVTSLVQEMIARGQIIQTLAKVGDIERITTRIAYRTASCRELKTLSRSLDALPTLVGLITPLKGEMLANIAAAISGLEELSRLIDDTLEDEPPATVREGGMIRAEANEQVAHLRSVMNDGREWITRIETAEREATGIKTLKVSYNRVFGYYIEITRSNLSSVPDRYIRRQTLANAERFVTQELKEMEGEILSASDRLKTLEYEIYCALLERLNQHIAPLQAAARAVAELDVLTSLAFVAQQNGYTAPEVDTSDRLSIKDGRHPVLERILTDALYVPNDVELDTADNRLAIITGPNMAGKSTYMRQIALITLMAQIGSYVPAKSARIGLVDRIFTRIGASDDLGSGQSTFMLEMTETAYILKNSTPRSLIIYDEIGRGTSTYDGMSIARAIIEHTAAVLRSRTVFATHYHELTSLEGELPGVKNYNITARKRGEELIFLRKIVRGGADDSYGIEVATLAGLPAEVIRRSKEILRALEQGNEIRPVASKRKAVAEAATPTAISFEDIRNAEIVEHLKKADLNVLTPIEAMNLLFELKKQAE